MASTEEVRLLNATDAASLLCSALGVNSADSLFDPTEELNGYDSRR
jgi:hypothetical protein